MTDVRSLSGYPLPVGGPLPAGMAEAIAALRAATRFEGESGTDRSAVGAGINPAGYDAQVRTPPAGDGTGRFRPESRGVGSGDISGPDHGNRGANSVRYTVHQVGTDRRALSRDNVGETRLEVGRAKALVLGLGRIASSKFATNLALACALLFSVSFSVVMPALMTDDAPPMLIWGLVVRTPVIAAEQPATFRFAFEYRKRADCWPPHGHGDLEIAIWQANAKGGLDKMADLGKMKAKADPMENQRESSVMLPALPAGHYLMQWSAVYTCSGIKHAPLDGPLVPFEVK